MKLNIDLKKFMFVLEKSVLWIFEINILIYELKGLI